MARTVPVNAGYTIINGQSRGINGEYVDCWLEWKLLGQQVAGNESRLHVLLYAQARIEVSTAWVAPEKFGYVGYDDGARHYKSTTYDFSGQQVNCFADQVFTVTHGADGSRSVRLQGMWSTAHSQYISGGSAVGEVVLPTIPRGSTVKATDANIGAVSMVSVLRCSPGYTHSVAWQFGDLQGFLTADGFLTEVEERLEATQIPFTVPENFYGQIPQAPYGICTLTCRTYDGSVPVGQESSCTCRLHADAPVCAPRVTGTVEDICPQTLALTGDPKVLVRYRSQAQCRMDAQAQHGATITQRYIDGQIPEGDTLVLSQVGSPQVVFRATDSRGYSTVFTPQDVSMVDYVPLTCNATLRRTDPTSGDAVLEGSGNWFSASFGAQNNTLALCCSVDGGDWVTLTPELKSEGYRFSSLLTGLDYRQAHRVQLQVQDALDTVLLELTVQKGIPVFDWGETDVAFHVPVSAPTLQLGQLMLTAVGEDPGADWVAADLTQLQLWKKRGTMG